MYILLFDENLAPSWGSAKLMRLSAAGVKLVRQICRAYKALKSDWWLTLDSSESPGEDVRVTIVAVDLADVRIPESVLAFHEGDQSYHFATLNYFDLAENKCWIYYDGIALTNPVPLPTSKVFKLPDLPLRSAKGGKKAHLEEASLVMAKNKVGSFVAAQLVKTISKDNRHPSYQVRDLHTAEYAVAPLKDLEVVYKNSKTAKLDAARNPLYPPNPHSQSVSEAIHVAEIHPAYVEGQEKLAKWRYDGELHNAVIKGPGKIDATLKKVVSYIVNFLDKRGRAIAEDLEVDMSNIVDQHDLPPPFTSDDARKAAEKDPATYQKGALVFAKDLAGDGCFNSGKVLCSHHRSGIQQWRIKPLFGERLPTWLAIENLRVIDTKSPSRLDPNGEPLFPTFKGNGFLLQNSGLPGRVLPKLHPPCSPDTCRDANEHGWRKDNITGEPTPCAKVAWRDITTLSKTRDGPRNNPVVNAQEHLAGSSYVNGILDGNGGPHELIKWVTSDGSRNIIFGVDETGKLPKYPLALHTH